MNEQPDSTENRIRILLVEDDPADRQAIERLIAREQLPYQIETATTCAEALERIRQSTYDVALLDYNLDDGTGLDTLSKLEDTPAIFITGSGDEGTAVLAMKQGAYDYLIKDLDRNYLKLLPHTIQSVLKRKQAGRELQQFAEKLQRSNEELQHFASVASHDLQEPLRKITAFGDLLKRHYGSSLGEKGNDYIKRMGDASERMERLIKDLLQFSRVTTKTRPFQSVNLGKIVHEILVDLEVRISETQGRVEIGHLPVIEADPSQMRQLFQNLISNALKFHKKGAPPVVHLNGRKLDNGFWEITVEDNGIGFNENYLEKIFKPFERLHGREQYPGSGIGLAICHKIVSRHGGTLTARSAKQKGATFIITLPEKQTGRKD